jgi:hypothetical protein
MDGNKIIKVSTDMEVTVHDFPQGGHREERRALTGLIGNGCEMLEMVMPKRLYTVFGITREVKAQDSKCVAMMVDEEFLCRDVAPELNLIGSYLYETDVHGNQILGNILFVGLRQTQDGSIDFAGIEEETFQQLHLLLEETVRNFREATLIIKELIERLFREERKETGDEEAN